MKDKRIKLIADIFTLWFLGTYVLMLTFTDYAHIFIGQFFLVLGLIGCFIFKKKSFKIGSAVFMVLGLCGVVVPILELIGVISFEILWNNIMKAGFFISLLVISLCIIIIPYLKYKHLKSVCTYEVTATIIDIKYNKNNVGQAIYGFCYQGKQWEVVENIYSRKIRKEMGMNETLKINPDKPEEFIVGNIKFLLLMSVVGVVFVVCLIPYLSRIFRTITFIK